jgi:hypothetical protein
MLPLLASHARRSQPWLIGGQALARGMLTAVPEVGDAKLRAVTLVPGQFHFAPGDSSSPSWREAAGTHVAVVWGCARCVSGRPTWESSAGAVNMRCTAKSTRAGTQAAGQQDCTRMGTCNLLAPAARLRAQVAGDRNLGALGAEYLMCVTLSQEMALVVRSPRRW